MPQKPSAIIGMRGIVGEADAAVVEETGEEVPAPEHVIHRLGCARRSLPGRCQPSPLFGGSAPALPVSRPARRSLALRPTWSLSRPGRPVAPECFSRSRYLLQPLRLLPAGATVAGRGSHPLGDGTFPRRTRVEDWRASFRVRWLIRLSLRASVRLPLPRFQSPLTAPACRFPAPGFRGSCASHTDHRDKGVGTGPVNRRNSAARRPSCLLHRRRCVAEPVHASTTSNRSSSTPSLLHVTRSGLSAIEGACQS